MRRLVAGGTMSDNSIGLSTGPLGANPDTVAQGIDAMPSSVGEVFGSRFRVQPNGHDRRARSAALCGDRR